MASMVRRGVQPTRRADFGTSDGFYFFALGFSAASLIVVFAFMVFA